MSWSAESSAYVPPGGGYPTRLSYGREGGSSSSSGRFHEAVQAASEAASTFSTRWVDTCNSIGKQTKISVSNYTDVSYALTLEVGGVVYQRETLPANEALVSQDGAGASLTGRRGSARDYLGSNFAVVKFDCGFVFYTITATPIVEDVSSRMRVKGTQRLHFVYGGSKVTLRSDLREPQGFKLLNESSEIGGNEMSEDLEITLEATRQSLQHVKDQYIDPAVQKVRTSIQNSMSSRNMNGGNSGANSSHAFGSEAYDDYSQAPSFRETQQKKSSTKSSPKQNQQQDDDEDDFAHNYYAPISSDDV